MYEWPVIQPDVGRAPVDVPIGLQVEDVVVRGRDADEVATCRVRDALGLGGRAGRVHEEEQVLGVHRLARAGRRIVGDVELVQPGVSTLPHLDVAARAADDEAARDAGRGGHGLVRGSLERHTAAAAPGLVLRHEHLAAHVIHPVGERVGREPAEDHGVWRADASAGEHRRGQLGNHPR
jgi:hypothetical protein